MCDPMTLVGIAASAGGVAMNAAAQSRVNAARNDAMKAERIRQHGLDSEADAINRGTQNKYKKFDRSQEKKSGQLQDYYRGQDVPEPSKESALPTTSSDITIAEEAKQRGQATALTDRTANALGELRSFGDVLGDKSLLQGRDANRVGQLAGFKQSSSNVLPFELEAANQKGDGMKLFADLLGGAGGLALGKGLSTAAPFKPTTSFGDFLGGTTVNPGVTTPIAPALTRAQGVRYGGLSSLYGVP